MTLYTRREAARALRIGLRTLDRRLADGAINCFRLGDGPKAPVRISETHLMEFLNKNSTAISDAVRDQSRAILSGRADRT